MYNTENIFAFINSLLCLMFSYLHTLSCLSVFPPLYPAKAQVYEKVSLQSIQQLVHRSYQTLALWKLLCDHQFSLIMSELPKVNVCRNPSAALQADAHASSLQCSPTCLHEYDAFCCLVHNELFTICPRGGYFSLHSYFFLCLQEFQEQMKGASFKDIVIRGKELSGALVTALINVYIKDNAPVDAISTHLRDICPLLYSSDDSVCSKVRTHARTHT